MQDLKEFNPTEAALHSLVEKTQKITASDLSDKAQMEEVRVNRIELKKARVAIEKQGEKYREDAVAYSKGVIAKVKELISIIEPEEDRLKQIEAQAKQNAEIAEIKAVVPDRIIRIAEIDPDYNIQEQMVTIESLSHTAFDTFLNNILSNKNERESVRLKEESDRVEAQKAENERKEREIAQAEEDRLEAIRIEGEQKRLKERADRDQHRSNVLFDLGFLLRDGVFEYLDLNIIASHIFESSDEAWVASLDTFKESVNSSKVRAEEARKKELDEAEEKGKEIERTRVLKEQADNKERIRREHDELEATKRYQKFLDTNAYDPKTDYLIIEPKTITLYRKVGLYKK